MATDNEVLLCPPELRATAIRLVLRELTTDQQVELVASLSSIGKGKSDPFDALIIGKRNNGLAAATWAQSHPGRVATLWGPQFVGAYDKEIADELIKAATNAARKLDVALLQSILPCKHSQSAKSLIAAGFIHAAELIYLEWAPTDIHGDPSPEIRFESYHPHECERLAKILNETYQGTLDCPQLDSIRSLEEIIEGYRATGDYDPKLWLFARTKTQDVGVVLLTNYASTRQMELIYMGVVPSARGLGYGAVLLRHAQRLALENRSEKLLLAVDAANVPALKIYRAAGFHEWARRSIYIFKFASVG